ncbi:phage tail tip lysozyme [Lactococcus cremoris]
MIRKIYLYDKMPTNLEENGIPIIDWKDLPEITRSLNNSFSFYGNYLLNGNNVKKIKKEKYLKAYTENGTYQYFRIKSVKKNLSGISITALHIGYEANRNFIQNAYVANGNGKQIMSSLFSNLVLNQPFRYESDVASYHQFTAKQVNPIDAMIGSNNGNQNLIGVCDAELDMDNYTLTLKERIGDDNGFRIDFGKNLASIEETVDDSAVVNRLFLVGGVPDDTDYNVEQDPVTFGYLSVSGVTEENVQIAKRENSECKTVEDLKKWGQTLFDNDRIHEPKVTHEVDMVVLENTLEYQNIYQKVASLKFGDTAYISLKNLDIQVQERMIEYTWYPTLAKYKSVVLGNDLEMYTSSIETQVNSVNKKIETKSNELINAVNNASQWITGNKGGYVLLDPKDAPRRILIMDKPNAAEAKKVWQWNVDGLGYSSTGIDGKYGLAMTRDGAIVADRITTGVLSGIKIRSVNNDFIIELYDGKIRFIKKDGSSEKEMFAFAPTYVNGQLQGINAIQNQGYSFALSSMGSNGAFLNVLEIPKESTADNRKLKLYGEVSVDGSLSINGEKVIPGQNGGGGGGGTGGYPPEVTTDADKFAWDAWSWLINNGYSKQAAAGILGNIQGEAGSSMNPDIDQIGGPGYGIVQWDGSAYPLIGSPTWDGREYVQRLMAAAGISTDYKTMEAQICLVNWCMYNGQWIGAVDPTSVEGFKNSTDPKQAAYAFEKNFERPATAHSERQDYAQAWYDKFKDLKPSQNTGEKGLEHLKAILGQRIGNGQCYGLSAEYSGFLGGCGLGAGTQYGLSHVSGNGSTSAAADIGIAYNWSEVGWKVIKNPAYKDLVVGAIMNYARGGHVGSWYADDTYGHTGIIRGLENGKIQTYEQNTEKGQICAELEREYYSPSDISSICIPPK